MYMFFDNMEISTYGAKFRDYQSHASKLIPPTIVITKLLYIRACYQLINLMKIVSVQCTFLIWKESFFHYCIYIKDGICVYQSRLHLVLVFEYQYMRTFHFIIVLLREIYEVVLITYSSDEINARCHNESI